jgi:peptidoglycan/LPS O-acetylase OafA/YrhL
MGLLDALCEGTFVQRPDGRILFFPWGALGRGYALSSDEEHRRLRRATKRLLVLGVVGLPVAVTGGMQSLGPGPIAAIGALLAVFGALCLVRLTRGLEPCPERITRAEANARVARALRRRWKRALGADGG